VILIPCAPEDIIAFSEKKCEEELKMKAPLLHSCMHAVAVCQKRQKKICGGGVSTSLSTAI